MCIESLDSGIELERFAAVFAGLLDKPIQQFAAETAGTVGRAVLACCLPLIS